jgi:hypothetical protein
MYEPTRPVKRLKSLAEHLASITEVFVADGAADEQLAGRMLLANGTRGTGNQILPNLRLVARDKPHSARRLLQRTLPKYPFINIMMSTLIWARGSLTKLVQYSAHFREKVQVESATLLPGRCGEGLVVRRATVRFNRAALGAHDRPLRRFCADRDGHNERAGAI